MDDPINSGLAGITLPAADAPAPRTATALALPSAFTPQKIAGLARELAINIRDPKDILRDFGCSQEQFDTLIKPNPLFANALETLIAEWNDAGNAPKRLRLQAQAILEDAMPSVGARISHKSEALKDTVAAFQAISKIAGMEAEKTPAGTGEKFTITINLGSDTLKYDKITGRPQGAIELIEEKSDAGT